MFTGWEKATMSKPNLFPCFFEAKWDDDSKSIGFAQSEAALWWELDSVANPYDARIRVLPLGRIEDAVSFDTSEGWSESAQEHRWSRFKFTPGKRDAWGRLEQKTPNRESV